MRLISLAITSLAACSFAAAQLSGNLGNSNSGSKPRRSDDPVIPEHFMCAQDCDCEVRNVGNCCGYYPMCANKTAQLPDPCPDGGFGVCGFPVVDTCKCGSLGGCVSYQNGNPVHNGQWDETDDS